MTELHSRRDVGGKLRVLLVFLTILVPASQLAAQEPPAPFVPKGINIPMGETTTVGGRPGIASDGTNFLMVYRGDGGAAWGKRVSSAGVVLDATGFKISTNPGTIREASVAFDGTNYLVVWEIDSDPSEIYGARVTPQGTVLDSPEIQITSGANAYPRPVAITFDGDNFLLVFRASGGPFPRFAMRGLRVNKSGASLDGPTGFPIYTGPAAYVSSAYDPVHQVHLAVWQDRSKGPWFGPVSPTLDTDVTGMRISKAGVVLDSQPIMISTASVNSNIEAAPLGQGAVGVAFDGTNFLVAWYDARPDATPEQATVYGARVAADGTVVDQPAFQIGDNYANSDATHTPVVCDATDCLVVWMYTSSRGYGAGYGYRGGIYTKRVSAGQVYARGIAASANFAAGFFPIAGMGNNQVLVAWGDQRWTYPNGLPDRVYAQLLQRGAGPAPPTLQPSGEDQPTSFSLTGFNVPDFVSGLGGMDERHLFAVTVSADAAATSLWRLQGNGWLIDQQYRFGGGRLYTLASTAHDFVLAVGQGAVNLYKVPLGGNWFFCCGSANVLAVQAFGTPRFPPNGIQVFAVGTRGLRQRFTVHPENYSEGNSYGILGENTGELGSPELDLGGIWGSSPTDVYAVGEFGTVLHYDGLAWNKLANIPTLQALNAVWGSNGHVFAAGDFGTVIHWDGAAWSVMETGTAEHLFGIAGLNPNDIYAVGTRFSVFHYDGTAWHKLMGGCCNMMLREVLVAGNRLFVAGESGQLLSHDLTGNNPTPGLSSIQPASAPTGSPDFTLAVNGEAFQPSSVVRWNGGDRATTFNSSGSLSATIASNDVAAGGVIAVDVYTPGPGGGSSQKLPFTILTQPKITFPGSFNFGNVLVGSNSQTQDFTISSTGTAALQIAAIGANDDFIQSNDCPQTLAIDASCTIHVRFVPSVTGPRNGSIVIADNAPGSPHAISLTGTGVAPSIQVLPGSNDFGGVNLGGSSSPQPFTITNNGTANLSLNQIFTTGDFTQTNDCPGQLTPAQNCTVNVTFTPTGLGLRSGQLFVSHNATGSPVSAALSGTGNLGPVPQVSLSTGALFFTPVVVGLIGVPQPLVITNTGAAELHIYGVFAESDWPFINCGDVLGVGASCTIQVFSRPAAVGARNGNLRIVTNAPGSPHLVGLSGSGAGISVMRPARGVRPPPGGSSAQIVTASAQPLIPTAARTGAQLFVAPIVYSPGFVFSRDDEEKGDKAKAPPDEIARDKPAKEARTTPLPD